MNEAYETQQLNHLFPDIDNMSQVEILRLQERIELLTLNNNNQN